VQQSVRASSSELNNKHGYQLVPHTEMLKKVLPWPSWLGRTFSRNTYPLLWSYSNMKSCIKLHLHCPVQPGGSGRTGSLLLRIRISEFQPGFHTFNILALPIHAFSTHEFIMGFNSRASQFVKCYTALHVVPWLYWVSFRTIFVDVLSDKETWNLLLCTFC
jgi:hypothetical protein